MDALKNATDKPLIIINESMQFSAGVNLTYTMNFADKGDFKSIEKFIKYFQETCKHLKYSDHPVISSSIWFSLRRRRRSSYSIKFCSIAYKYCNGIS